MTTKPLHQHRPSVKDKVLRANFTVPPHLFKPNNSEGVRKYAGQYVQRKPEPGEALPRNYPNFREAEVYKPEPMVSLREHSEDFLKIKSVGEPT